MKGESTKKGERRKHKERLKEEVQRNVKEGSTKTGGKEKYKVR